MEDITKLNGADYRYEYKISNGNGKSEIKFNDSAVLLLSIENNIFDPFADGFVTFANAYNWIERKFIFRGDGTDKFHLELEAKDNGSNPVTENAKMKYDFIITGEANFIDDSTQNKNRKTYTFVHQDKVMLQEMFSHEKRFKGKVGDIIKEILEAVSLKTDNIEPGELEIKDFPDYIVPYLKFRYIDILYYMLRFYYHKQDKLYVKGFLNRDMKTNKYSLKLLTTDYFDKYKELTEESFHIGALVYQETSDANPNNPSGAASDEKTKTYGGNIVSVNTTPADINITNSLYLNSLIIGYDDMLGTMRTNRLTLKDVIEEWKKKFIDTFKTTGGKAKKHVLLTDRKASNEYKVYRLPFSCKDNTNIVFADMINSLTLCNSQINLNVIGDIGRTSGTFIDIYKKTDDEIKGDAVVLGTWFITSLRHLKIANTLRTEMYGVKTYAGPKFDDSDGTITNT